MNDGLKGRHRDAVIRILSANPRVDRVVLFGSRATRTHRPNSDVDIVLFGEGLTLEDQAALLGGIQNLTMPQEVDLLLYHRIGDQGLREEIDRQGVEWFVRPK